MSKMFPHFISTMFMTHLVLHFAVVIDGGEKVRRIAIDRLGRAETFKPYQNDAMRSMSVNAFGSVEDFVPASEQEVVGTVRTAVGTAVNPDGLMRTSSGDEVNDVGNAADVVPVSEYEGDSKARTGISMRSISNDHASSVLLHNSMPQTVLLVVFVLFMMAALIGAMVFFFDNFDIEILDRPSGGTRLYKWMWEAYDPDVGVEAVTGSHVFQDYHHIDIELTSENIAMLLTSYRCGQHVKPYIPEILSDCIRESSRFMVSDDRSRLLLIRDSVMVRFTYRSHLLVKRMQDGSDEATNYVIPTLDKRCDVRPEKAAERWCTRSLHFTDFKKHARFIESGELVHYIDKYKGLQTVERKSVVIVHCDQDNPQMPTFQDNQPLLWMPLSEIESCPKIPKNIALAEANLWVGGKLHHEVDLRELEEFLKTNGVDTKIWTGRDGTNTSEALLNEIRHGECMLKLEGTTVKRVINLVALRLRLLGEGDTLLADVGLRDSNGVIKWNSQLPGTKQKVNETMEAAADRICTEQLGLRERDFELYPETCRDFILNASASKTYPGIFTAYYTYLVTVDLRDDAPLASEFASWVPRCFRKLQRVSPRKIGTGW